MSYADFLAHALLPGYSAKQYMKPEEGAPVPTPNPLRAPPTKPSFLENLLMPGMQVGRMLLPPAAPALEADRKKQRDFDEQAQLRYRVGADNEKQQGRLPSSDPGSAGPGAGEVADDEAVQDTDDLGAETAAATRGPGGQVRVPVGPASPIADPVRAAMLQAGLALMVPTWGNSLSQIGQAAGQGAAAAGRAENINTQEQRRVEGQEDRALNREGKEADIDKTKAETAEIKSGESSRSRRLRGKTPSVLDEAANAAGLGAKGKAYLQQRLKSLNEEDLLGEDADAVERFNQIIAEAKRVDAPTASPAAPAATPVTPAKAPNIGGTEQATNLPLIKSPEEAAKLKPGTRFLYEKDGKLLPGRVPN
jgi:hypothetical protein